MSKTLEEVKTAKKEKAQEYLNNGFHCSQSTLAALADDVGITENLALRLGGCYGAGMCCGEACGAVVSSLLAIGLKYGHFIPGDDKAKFFTNELALEFMRRFKEKNGSILCRDLLGYDISKPEEKEIIMERVLFKSICPLMVKSAIDIMYDIFDENPERV